MPSPATKAALKATFLGWGTESWISPRRRKWARAFTYILAICLGLGIARTLDVLEEDGEPIGRRGAAWFLAGMLVAGGASLGYGIVVGTELYDKRTYERQLVLANLVQQRLFPERLPEGPGVRFAAYHRTAHAVGGDYYDVIPLPDGRYVVVMADVSGKGVPAALLMAGVRAQVRLLARRGSGPEEILQALNASLLEETEDTRFVTIFVARLDPASGRMEFANAGHPGPLIQHNGTIATLDAGGPPAGAFAAVPYERSEATLAPGSRMVLFTDGVTEAQQPDGELFEMQRLQSVVKGAAADSADSLVGAVVKAVRDFEKDREAADDLTLLVVETG